MNQGDPRSASRTRRGSFDPFVWITEHKPKDHWTHEAKEIWATWPLTSRRFFRHTERGTWWRKPEAFVWVVNRAGKRANKASIAAAMKDFHVETSRALAKGVRDALRTNTPGVRSGR